MAFIKLKKCLSSPNQLLKLIIVIGCICFSIYQLFNCVEKIMNPPISTYYRFYLNDSIKYPSVTVCRRPSFKSELYDIYGMARVSNLMHTHAFRNFLFDNFSIEEFINETTYGYDEVFAAVAYAGKGNDDSVMEIREFQTLNKGRCFTFIPRTTSTTFSIAGGWWLYLKHNYTTRITDSFGQSLTGFHIHMHDDNEIMTSETEQENNFLEYVYLESAEDMRINLKVQEFQKIDTKDNPCIDNDPHWSRSKCQESCLHYQIASEVNCTLPWLWLLPDDTSFPQCSTYPEVQQLISGFQSHHRRRYVSNCQCPISCEVTIYSPSIISRKEVEERNYPDSFIAIYYTTNLVTYMNEMIGYNINGFVSDIGGSLGFLLGLSVIGFIAVLEKMICSIIKTFFKKKDKDLTCEEEPKNYMDEKLNCKKEEIDNRKNKMKKREIKEMHMYDNLKDFDSDDFKYYQKTLIAEPNRF